MSNTQAVREQYAVADVLGRVKQMLAEAGWSDGQPIAWQQLAGLDQFHLRGLKATEELAEELAPLPDTHVLDVGSGLAGAARYLAAVRGCRVTGIELTPQFVEAARYLSERAGLADRLRFIEGDASRVELAPETFDHAWTQHVGMNIPDKHGLYRQVAAALRPGGRFAIYDVVRGVGDEPVYPLPWAGEASISFLVTADELLHELDRAGFGILCSRDTTPLAIEWLHKTQERPLPSVSLLRLMGPTSAQVFRNLGRCIADGRLQTLEVIAEKR